MTILLFLILVVLLAMFLQRLGILGSVLALLAFIVFGISMILFVELLFQDAVMRWSMFVSAIVVGSLAVGLRHYFYKRQLAWKKESEEWLANRRAQKNAETEQAASEKPSA